jgi:hypothetical protein
MNLEGVDLAQQGFGGPSCAAHTEGVQQHHQPVLEAKDRRSQVGVVTATTERVSLDIGVVW